MSAGGTSRQPASRRAMRVRSISARASGALSGGSASARSATTSTLVPPAPNRITGPNSGSTCVPAISSSARGRCTIGCTVKPSITASGRAAATRWRIASAALRTAAASASSSATPPTSLLWLICGERIFSTTG